MTTVHHPLNFEALKKGDVISQTRIEDISKVRYVNDPEQYTFEQLRLVNQIETYRPDLYIITRKREIQILFDPGAMDHRRSRLEKDVRSMKRNAIRGARIDHSQLSERERKHAEFLDRQISVAAMEADRTLQEARKAIRALDGGLPARLGGT